MRGTTPGPGTAIIDPAGLNYIRQGPAGAGGAAGEIYRWLGIANDTSFPDPVREAIEAPLTAKFHAYDAKLCVHVVGPDFRDRSLTEEDAVGELTAAYGNVLREFLSSGAHTLRLLPLSGGIFAGNFRNVLPEITGVSLERGYAGLDPEAQHNLLTSRTLELCIYIEGDYQCFARTVANSCDP